jgi:hypothetical protein
MTDRELMQQALDALEEFCEHQIMLRPIEKRDALRERLAQPEQNEQPLFDDWRGGFPYKGCPPCNSEQGRLCPARNA